MTLPRFDPTEVMKCDKIADQRDMVLGYVDVHIVIMLQQPYNSLLWARAVRSVFDQYGYNSW